MSDLDLKKATKMISVVVPVIRLRQLERCLRSVVESVSFSLWEQREPDLGFELLIRNACEDPKEKTLVANLADKYGFKNVDAPFVDMVQSWNHCVEMSSGKYIHILADDDYVRRGFYSTVIQLTKTEPLVVSTGYEVEQDGVLNFENRVRENETNMLNRLQTGNPLVPSAVVISRAAYEAVGGYRDRGVLDWDLYLRIASFAAKKWNRENPAWRLSHEYLVRRTEDKKSDTQQQGAVPFFRAILNVIEDHEDRRGIPRGGLPARQTYGSQCFETAMKSGDEGLFRLARKLLGIPGAQ